MKTALFTNFTDKEFIGYWDGKARKFTPGESKYMPDYLAQHFARHLTNRVLIEKGLERATSPKFPEQIPEYMQIFNKAYIPDTSEELGENKKTELDIDIEVANKNKEIPQEKPLGRPKKQNPKEPQVVLPPDFEED